MCVIFICEKERPSEHAVRDAFEANGSGVGLAWRQTEEDGSTRVHWRKGIMDVEPAIVAAQEAPLPFVIHFRIPTYGGKTPLLTHPFLVTPESPLWLAGDTPGTVMFHNGHWHTWKSWVLDLCKLSGGRIQLPDDIWSDSRAMAFAAAHCGKGVLEFIDEKAVVFGPEDISVYGAGWTRVQNMIVSNEHWRRRKDHYYLNQRGHSGAADKEEPQSEHTGGPSSGPVTRTDLALIGGPGGSTDIATFRTAEAGVSGGHPEQESVEKGAQAVLPAHGQAGQAADRRAAAGDEGTIDPALIAAGVEVTKWVRTLNPSTTRRALGGADAAAPDSVYGTRHIPGRPADPVLI